MLNWPRLTPSGTSTALTWQAARVGRGVVVILGLGAWCVAPGAAPAGLVPAPSRAASARPPGTGATRAATRACVCR